MGAGDLVDFRRTSGFIQFKMISQWRFVEEEQKNPMCILRDDSGSCVGNGPYIERQGLQQKEQLGVLQKKPGDG